MIHLQSTLIKDFLGGGKKPCSEYGMFSGKVSNLLSPKKSATPGIFHCMLTSKVTTSIR